MITKIQKVIADWMYLTPLALNKFRNKHPDETIYAYGATKAQISDSEEAISGVGWAFSRRSILILTDKRLKCGDWNIQLSKVKYAEATQYSSSGLILKIADVSGNHYQFGLQNDPTWLNQTVLPIKVTNEPVKYSKLLSIVRVIAYISIAIWFLTLSIDIFS